ncbi:MAG: site-2 protease family protein [Candidatus Nealsonbacteria bacterium]
MEHLTRDFYLRQAYAIIDYMEYLFLIVILIFSVVIHEVAHGATANYLGDPTAKYAGRLTLNPIKHLDPIGSVILPLVLIIMAQVTGGGIIFGWAKPVPINPFNFRDRKYGSAKVSLAGPGANLAVALFFGLALRLIPFVSGIPGLVSIFSYIVYINILLAVFNLLPIPPLDGSHILFTFLPGEERIRAALSQYGLFILLFVLFFFFPIIVAIVKIIFRLIVGGSFF